MEQPPQLSPMPKKSCMITLMFGITDDSEALAVKKVIDDAMKDVQEKRYKFEIIET